MIKYLTNSDISARVNLNPFNWTWLPAFGYDGPTEVMPTRHTIVIVWLFIQIFFDLHDGAMDFTKLAITFNPAEEVIEVEEEDDKPKVGL
jgi:hypothetical protein